MRSKHARAKGIREIRARIQLAEMTISGERAKISRLRQEAGQTLCQYMKMRQVDKQRVANLLSSPAAALSAMENGTWEVTPDMFEDLVGVIDRLAQEGK